MSKVYANTFQTFNIYVDRAMEHLTDAELRVLLYATRHIMGWQDKITSLTSCMSLAMFEKGFTVEHKDGTSSTFGGCGLSRPVISKALNSLESLGFIERAGFEQDKGQRWRLAEDPKWDALEARSAEKTEANKQRTAKATAARVDARYNVARTTQNGVVTSDVNSAEEHIFSADGVVTSDDTMVVTSDVPKQTQDQTQETTTTTTTAPALVVVDSAALVASLMEEPTPEEQANGKVFDAYHANIGMLTPMLADKITLAIEEYGHDWVIEAIGVAVTQNRRAWSYVDGVLKNWRRDGKQVQKGGKIIKLGVNVNDAFLTPEELAALTPSPNAYMREKKVSNGTA